MNTGPESTMASKHSYLVVTTCLSHANPTEFGLRGLFVSSNEKKKEKAKVPRAQIHGERPPYIMAFVPLAAEIGLAAVCFEEKVGGLGSVPEDPWESVGNPKCGEGFGTLWV